MKQPLHVKLILEFILEKKGRPFEEVKAYSDEIGATEEDLEEAVFQISEQNVEFVPSKHSLGKFEKINDPSDDQDNANSPSYRNESSARNFDQNTNSTISFKPSNIKNKLLVPLLNNKKLLTLPLLIVIIALGTLMLNIFKTYPNTKDKEVNKLTQKVDQIPARQAYAAEAPFSNKEVIDAKKVFSFPSSGVTLKFSGTPKRDIMGFFPYWMMDASDKVNLTGITEIAIFGLTSDRKGNIVIKNSDGEIDQGYQMWGDSRLDTFIQKARRRGIKVFITIKVFNNPDIESISQSDENQKQFIANALELVKMKSLDGIVIDFEYVGVASEKVTDGYSRFIANLNAEMKREFVKSKLYICTYLVGAVAPGFADIQKLGQHSDKLVVMGYDVHTPRGGAGPVAPMNGNIDIIGSIESYLLKVDNEKIMLAVPYYGYDWAVNSSDTSSNTGVAYGEIQANSKNTKILWDETSQTPYYFYTDSITKVQRVLHFENTRSLGVKYDYINSKNLGGVAIWALGYDGLSQELGQLLLEKFAL